MGLRISQHRAQERDIPLRHKVPCRPPAVLRLAALPCSALGNTRPPKPLQREESAGERPGPVVRSDPGATPLLTSHVLCRVHGLDLPASEAQAGGTRGH